jgi:hypothetical protein
MSNPDERNGAADGAGLSSTGTAAAIIAAVAGICCLSPVLLPFIFGFLGATGAARAAGLRPYSGWILVTTGLVFAVGFRAVYRPRSARHLATKSGKRRILPVIAKGALWGGALSWVVALVLFLRP